MPFVIGLFLILVAAVLLHVLAERDRQRRRRELGLNEAPTAFELYRLEIYRRRARCEARLGISPPVRRGDRV